MHALLQIFERRFSVAIQRGDLSVQDRGLRLDVTRQNRKLRILFHDLIAVAREHMQLAVINGY